MEKERHVLTEEEKQQFIESKKAGLSEEELNAVSGGWLWQDSLEGKSWYTKENVRFCFEIGERVKLMTLFGDGEWGTVINRKVTLINPPGRWVDTYLVQIDGEDASEAEWNRRSAFLWLDEYDS